MPRPPGIIDRVNYVVNFAEDPCHAPWTVYAETALEALGEVFMAFVDITPTDVLRFYVKPRGMRSAGRFGGEVLEEDADQALNFLPDINELVGTLLPGATFLAESLVHDKLLWFWVIDGVIERILWYWLLIDLGTQFLYDWTTLINQSEQDCGGIGGSCLKQGDSMEWTIANQWFAMETINTTKQWGDVIAGNASTIGFMQPGGSFQAGCAIVPYGDVTAIEIGILSPGQTEPTTHSVKSGPFDAGIAVNIMESKTITTVGVYEALVRFQRLPSINPTGVILSNMFCNGFGEKTGA